MPEAKAALGRHRADTEATTPLFVTKKNRVNILFVSEGYRDNEADKGLFLNYYNVFHDELVAIKPYTRYQNFFNIQAIFVPSVDSGVDHPPCSDTRKVFDPKEGQVNHNTAFGAAYCQDGIQ